MRPHWMILAVLAVGLCPRLTPAQELPSGFVRVGDMIVREGPEAFTGTAWPGGDVHYFFNSNVNATNRARARDAMAEIEAVCHVDFIESSSPTLNFGEVVEIKSSTNGNSATVGLNCFAGFCFNEVNIQSWASRFIIVHELIHTLGYRHEQTRPDRNNFVQINTQNIQQGQQNNFQLQPNALTFGLPYDFDSVMHYGDFAFSICTAPGGPPCTTQFRTITVLPPNQSMQSAIGQRLHMSVNDALRLQAIYGAPLPPSISSLSPTSAPANGGPFTLTVNGVRFNRGTIDGAGVQGSQVLWNGVPLQTTYVSPTELQAQVPGCLLASGENALVSVENPTPAGGVSTPRFFDVVGGPSPIMISEVSWANPDGLEITNFSGTPQSMVTWKIQWDDGNLTEIFLIDLVLDPFETVVFRESHAGTPETPPGIRVFTLPSVSTSAHPFSVALVNGQGQTVDEVRIGADPNVLPGPGSPALPPDLGGVFRGVCTRGNLFTGGGICVERIWGLDSDSAGDWTAQFTRSFGLVNAGNGLRGFDPLATDDVVLNEIARDPDYVEVRNVGSAPVDLEDWELLVSGRQNDPHVVLRPWTSSVVLQPGEYAVVGNQPFVPAELPGGTPYVNLSSGGCGGALPITTEEFSCALYDDAGRLRDLVRAPGHDDVVVHNSPRAPAHWRDFVGAAGRADNTPFMGRDASSTDTDTGADWGPLPLRSMGQDNPPFSGPVGRDDELDVRLEDTADQGGLVLIVNAGSSMGGMTFGLLSDYQHSFGQGPFIGLTLQAYTNWTLLSPFEPWNATLDSNGAYRFDLPAGLLPTNFVGDHRALVLHPSTGQILRITEVLEEDHL